MKTGWTAVVPIKAWGRAKSRLEAPPELRAEFARAVALDTLDTVTASRAVGRVVVVTPEPELVDMAAGLRPVAVLREPRGNPSDRLNDAIRVGRDWAIVHAPTAPVAVIPADLPALTATCLEAALHRLAWFERAHIPDHRGDGTTLSAAARPDLLAPCYGRASERAHAAAGSVPVIDVEAGVRLDVDSLEDLSGATLLGPGPRVRRTSLARSLVASTMPGCSASSR